jgi:L-aminopeptidase/D-esterase-like protein
MNGSGDLFIAFSTANLGVDEGNSTDAGSQQLPAESTTIKRLVSGRMDALFAAVVQATEEAVDNALVAAQPMTGPNYWVVPALPHDQLKDILRRHGVLTQ